MSETHHITPYKDTETSKKRQVTKMFDSIAPYYDFLNRFLSLGIDVRWRKKAIKEMASVVQENILDVATGTADLAIESAKKLKVKKVVGLDISAEMLKLGEKKIAKLGLQETIELVEGDSENLPYADASFDITMSAFGVRNFENLTVGLTEMYRVLTPGGNIMVLEFSKPKSFPLKQIFGVYFKYFLPMVGKLKSKDPKAYTYLYESVQLFPDYEKFTNILKKIGFKNTRFIPLTGGICTIYVGTK
ncbi:MAG: bifunctional demethylmenaquinone methyltransferase/2-methoxy-6-polyprenyl-1,4-benzoquinol methylase UbiE [Saprospiraceae bacterium]